MSKRSKPRKRNIRGGSKNNQLPIFIHRSHSSMLYFNSIRRAIRKIEYPKHLKSFAKKTTTVPINGKNKELYEEYISFVANQIWDDPEIQRLYPDHMFSCALNDSCPSILIKLWSIKKVKTQNGLVYRSKEDVSLKVFGETRILHWTSHAIQRIIERTNNDYWSMLSVSCLFYFLDWFEITTYNNKLYILLYIPYDVQGKISLVGAAPIMIEDNKLVAKTFLPFSYCKKIWADYDKDIDKPDDYNFAKPEKNEDLKWHCANLSKGERDVVWQTYT